MGCNTLSQTQDISKREFVYQMDISLEPIDKLSSDLIARQIKLMDTQKKIYILNNNKVLTASIRSYKDAIKYFVGNNQWKNVLDLCIKIYKGEYQYLGDVPASLEQKKSILHPYIKEIVVLFVKQSYSSIVLI